MHLLGYYLISLGPLQKGHVNIFVFEKGKGHFVTIEGIFFQGLERGWGAKGKFSNGSGPPKRAQLTELFPEKRGVKWAKHCFKKMGGNDEPIHPRLTLKNRPPKWPEWHKNS